MKDGLQHSPLYYNYTTKRNKFTDCLWAYFYSILKKNFSGRGGMYMNNLEWKLENEWLQMVLEETQKQMDENLDYQERFRKDALETHKELWEEVGSLTVNNGLEQIVSFMGFMDRMKAQKRKHEITRRFQEKYEKMLQSPYFGRIDFC
jgi:DNA helicase II / ATP-dependent DNA helicase PcrA